MNNQRSAADALYGAGNTTAGIVSGNAGNTYNAGNTNAGILAGMQQQSLANSGVGIQAGQQALDAQNAGANAALTAEAARRGIPVQALGLLAQIGIPIAGLGGQSTGQSSGTQQMSGAQQFATIAGGVGKLLAPFGGGGAFSPGGAFTPWVTSMN